MIWVPPKGRGGGSAQDDGKSEGESGPEHAVVGARWTTKRAPVL